MQGIDIFTSEKFGSIRAIEESGRVLFCGSDVARALGYTNSSKALADHCRCVTKRDGVSVTMECLPNKGATMNEVQIFNNNQFGEIRTIEDNGKVLFCAVDIARALGYSNPHDAIGRHCRGVVKREGVSVTTNQHGVSTEQVNAMSFIPEGDVYRLITHSKLPTAEKFESWVFDEVLPSIRESIGLKQHEALLLLSRENQKRGNQKLYEVGLREKSDYCKAAKIAGKATANCMHKDKAVSKKDVPEDFLPLYDGLFEDTVFLMCMKERFGMDFSVSETIYRKWGIPAETL